MKHFGKQLSSEKQIKPSIKLYLEFMKQNVCVCEREREIHIYGNDENVKLK